MYSILEFNFIKEKQKVNKKCFIIFYSIDNQLLN
jgi:hypothetical protein